VVVWQVSVGDVSVEQLGTRIRQQRRACGRSAADVARQAGITAAHLGDIERRWWRAHPRARGTVARIARALGTTPDALAGTTL